MHDKLSNMSSLFLLKIMAKVRLYSVAEKKLEEQIWH